MGISDLTRMMLSTEFYSGLVTGALIAKSVQKIVREKLANTLESSSVDSGENER